MIEAIYLDELEQQLDAKLIGEDVMFSRLSTDTRSLQAGDAYLALKGDRFDGHAFVPQAEQAGAVALVVEQKQNSTLAQLLVPDTHVALGAIARLNRQKSAAKIVALTGSQGKTTVKEMTYSILGNCAATLATTANLNNTIGVPLCLLQLEKQHEYAVIEMGANRAGEIAFSAGVALPDIALITNANAAHVEGFGSLDGIVLAKGEILDALAADGIAVLNADDPNVGKWQERAAHCQQRTFSVTENSDADYRAVKIRLNREGRFSFCLQCSEGEIIIDLPLLGRHNISNAMAAAGAALAAGATLEHVKQGLEAVEPVSGRLMPVAGIGGATLIDDTYNASPASFFAAIDVLAQYPGQTILIAGDMKELGVEAESSHRAIGEYAAHQRIDELWVVGEYAQQVSAGFGNTAREFTDKGEIIEAGRKMSHPGVAFLVKGSRGSRMETIVQGLKAQGAD